jgi:hypothetical protein
MEKALEFLKDLLVKTRLDEEIVSEHIVFDIKEAIIELEEAMKTKTCDGCKSDLPYRQCKKDVFRPQKKDNTFGCNKHEPKDNA